MIRDVSTTTADAHGLVRRSLLALLGIKDVDIRMQILEQARTAVDRGLHAGGAFSATIPLVALYYSGLMRFDVENPTAPNQDQFILSKGHAVATIASIYADLGYFDPSILTGSRSAESVLNGHPGPLLPGVHSATGPMGQGVSVAAGLALAGRIDERYDVFTLTGDGELQEGQPWETIMYAGSRGLDNYCVLVDFNRGQLDNPTALHVDMEGLSSQFHSFGWRVFDVDATQYGPVYAALETFKTGQRDGRPTVIICRTIKGWGAGARELVKHKTTVSDALAEGERAVQARVREERITRFLGVYHQAVAAGCEREVASLARHMNLAVDGSNVSALSPTVRLTRATKRDKKIETGAVPQVHADRAYAADEIIRMAMSAAARDARVASIDSDLSSTSGLYAGVASVDQRRAENVGIAEASMMAMGEGFAIRGYNTWVSTFCPFFNWNVMRRIAVSYQERAEVIAAGGWLSDGHNLDLTFLATASNFETKVNGATHMGNDDVIVYGGIAHVKIIDVSCPNLLMAVVGWILEGNRGLNYVRVLRAPADVIYAERPVFEYGKSLVPRGGANDDVAIVTSGRGVHEALAAADLLARDGVGARVVDMPSPDESTMLEIHDNDTPVLFAEQNNGFLYAAYQRVVYAKRTTVRTDHVRAVNALDESGNAQFVHSATYEQLIERFCLSPPQLASECKNMLT